MVIVTGSVAYDQILDLPGEFSSYILPEKIHQINISFVTETHRRRLGGTGGNQACTLSLLGVPVMLVASAGNDFQQYDEFLKKTSVDTKFIVRHKTEPTAAGFAITDMKDNQIWGFSKGAMKYAKDISLKKVISSLMLKQVQHDESIPFIVIGPNEPLAIARYIDECVELDIPFAFDPAFYIPTLPIDVLKKGVAYARIIFGNDYEIEMLKSKLRINNYELRDGQILVTTLGEKGSRISVRTSRRQSVKDIRVGAANVKKVVDPTGAGDAYRAGFIAGFVEKKDIRMCGQMGAVAASFAIEKYGTMEHRFTQEEFGKRMMMSGERRG